MPASRHFEPYHDQSFSGRNHCLSGTVPESAPPILTDSSAAMGASAALVHYNGGVRTPWSGLGVGLLRGEGHQMQTSPSGSLIDRMMGAARLDVATYEEVEHDTSATMQAAIVVVLAAVAAGIGALGDGATGLIGGIVGGIVGWIVYAAATYLVGTKLLAAAQTEADLGQLLRTIGFARTPGILNVVGFVPVLGWIVGLVAAIWVIVTTVIAIRQALEMTTWRAIATAIIALILDAIVVG